MAENAAEKESDKKGSEGSAKDSSVEASSRMIGEIDSAESKAEYKKVKDAFTSSLGQQGSEYLSNTKLEIVDSKGGKEKQADDNKLYAVDENGKRIDDGKKGNDNKGGVAGTGDKGGKERQPDDNKLYAVDEKGNRIDDGKSGNDNKGGVPGTGDKGGKERQPDDNKLYSVDEKGNRIDDGKSGNDNKGGVPGTGDKGGKEPHPDDNKLYPVDEQGNRISNIDVNGARDTGLPPSDSFDPEVHGDRQDLNTGDSFFRLRGTQFLHRENGDSFMLNPDGTFNLKAQDQVSIQSENGVTRITFRNGDELEFDGSGIRRVTGRGREARPRR